MYNHDSIQAVAAARISPDFAKPLYDTYCFSQIPQTVFHLLTGEGHSGLPTSVLGDFPQRYDKVILLFVDAFGWQFFQQYQGQHDFLRRFVEQGVVSKINSQFPSATAAHVTTIHSGLPVGQSGVFEWVYYEPLADEVIAPLLFSVSGDYERNTLQKRGFNGDGFFPDQTIYQRLGRQGVKSYVFQNSAYLPSPYSDKLLAGAKVIPYKTNTEALLNLTDAVINSEGPAYFFCYFEPIDTIAHRYGPGSRHLEAEVRTMMTTLEQTLYQSLAGKAENTLLLVTADHGQLEVKPETTVYLNRHVPQIQALIKTNQRGQLLTPAGSPRDLFLYVWDECIEDAYGLLAEKLEGLAEIHRTADLIEQGFFGSGKPSAEFLSRVSNLLVLPTGNEQVWWHEDTVLKSFRGMHGGMTPEEMETILLALPL
ncbi:MAG: alkaline phosphatase family protein [Chloroflexi bacterium]|nr:alkaline phosphatase family protein [Chloroflexota bacterium]